MQSPYPYRASFSPRVKEALQDSKNNNQERYVRTQKQIDKLLKAPELGKPLRYRFRNCRRLHVGSFVLIYEIREARKEIYFIDLDHHDKIYKK